MTDPEVYIYTDGGAKGNPGPGGYGVVMEWVGRSLQKEFSQGYQHTTNNRMELLAVIDALKKLKKQGLRIKIFTDSKYVSDAIEKGWLFKWEKKGFKDKKNVDLWLDFLKYYRQHEILFCWVKGHNGHPQNERCDAMATQASASENLLIDSGFKNNTSPKLPL